MGYSPQQVDVMSLWQFTACCDGYTAANGGHDPKPTPPSDEEFLSWADEVRGSA